MNQEKIFWFCVIVWFVLRLVLLGCQYCGNADLQYKAEILKYFSEEDIRAGKEYSLSGFWFKAIYGTLYIGILILLLRFGFFAKLWEKVTSIAGEGLLKNDLFFCLAFFFLLQLLALPSSWYFGYYRESISGFSNIDFIGWLFKFFKAISMNIVLESFIAIVVLLVLRLCPQKWPYLLPITLGILASVFIVLMPIVMTPLFYEQKPLDDNILKERLMGIAQKANLEVNEIYVINESKYSKHTNAYFSGFGKLRQIVLYDNLIKNHDNEETALIFAHEAGHWKHNHMLCGLICGTLGALIACFAINWLFGYFSSVKWFGLKSIHSASSLPFFMILYMIFQLFFAPIESQISQYMEKQADLTSIELTGLNETFKNAQIRLAKDNKSDLLPHPLRVFWLYSHPTALERIKLTGK